MGIYTAHLDRNRTIFATTEAVRIRYHRYEDVTFADFLTGLTKISAPKRKFKHPSPHQEPKPLGKSELTKALTMADFFRIVALHLDERCCVVSDVGDSIFGAMGIRTSRRAEFVAPAYYLSMGFAVPGAIGVETANPALRPFVIVGDGAFQMTGTELSTAVRLGLKPIVFILNNNGYGTMRKIRDGSFNVISQWDYCKICDLVGGGVAARAGTLGQLDGAIVAALGSNTVRVIEVSIPEGDYSPQLLSLSGELAKLRGEKKN
jgi:indolepyruvate decarboxylase